MMDLSFRYPHPRFPSRIGELSFRIHTFDNVYGLDGGLTTVEEADGVTTISASGLTWAGGQQISTGTLTAVVTAVGEGVRVTVTGNHPDGIRSIAVTVHDVATGDVTGVREGRLEVGQEGRIVRYPNGWHDLATPFLAIEQPQGRLLTAGLRDDVPRPATFALVPQFGSPEVMDVDLLVEADATRPSSTLAAEWMLEAVTDATPALVTHREHVQAAYPTEPWETRADVPEWMRQISLVMTLHGRHFTGRVFLDYDAMLTQIRRVAEQLSGERILAYVPGWEGRYYRWYGRYDTDPALGGSDGFHRLIGEARELGVHVMPMFGSNIASRDVEGFERWGAPGVLHRASGLVDAGSVDWDGSRHYDHGSGALLNPAFAPWRAHLVDQVASLQQRFGFDATFLDITAMHGNDPAGSTTEGLRSLVDELHSAMPGHLVAGEAWFDALSSITPLVQTGHRFNVPVYHDLPDEDLFAVSNRSFGHVNLGDAAHGSSGVHEAGYVKAWRLPVRKAVIPTMGVVEDTLDAAPERVALIIEDAHRYAEEFLTTPVTTA